MLSSTRTFRNRQAVLRALVEVEVRKAWPLLDLERLDATFPIWARQVAGLVAGQRSVSALLATRYLRELGVATKLVGPVPAAVLLSSLQVTGPISVKQGMTAGKGIVLAGLDALSASSAAAVRHVLEGGNELVRASAVADPNVRGWQRVASLNACTFCSMLADRGGVYTEESADFECHDGCNCSVEPVV